MRIGQGFDVHALVPGRKLVLGGVHIPHHLGLEGHSDADVLLHAICDALLGAAGLGDIGMHFPDTDSRWKDADSRAFIRHVRDLLKERDFVIVNVDATVICEAPRLGKYREAMRTNIAADLGVNVTRVNIKATTSEQLGFIGRREGLACQAIAMIEHIS